MSVIKFYNFIRSNKSAPIQIKLKVLKSCVMSSLLYNCETFGNSIPKGLESAYCKMLKCCLDVRCNVPNHIAFVETGFLPLRTLVHARQWKFYRRFQGSIAPQSRRYKMLQIILESQTTFVGHYVKLSSKYSSAEEIITEGRSELKRRVHHMANTGHYKYRMYVEINPDLSPSPFFQVVHPVANDIIRLRLGSHYFPIETGRWNRTPRQNRICTNCSVLGDEKHYIYYCPNIARHDIILNDDISKIWEQPVI